MNAKAWVPLILAVGLGLVAAVMAKSMLVKDKGIDKNKGVLVPVVVATKSVQPGKALGAEDLVVVHVEPAAAPDNPYTDPQQLNGRVVLNPLVKGQQIFETLLAPEGSGKGLQALIPAGMRAITVEVNEFSGVAGLLNVGSRVDVMATFQNAETHENMSRAIVTDIQVIAVGQRTTPETVEGEVPAPIRSVTLLTKPVEAETIELACNVGRPRLVLRNGKDESKDKSDGITLAELRGTVSTSGGNGDPFLPVSNKTPSTQPSDSVVEAPKTRQIQVIRAGTETSITFQIPSAPKEGMITELETK